MEQRPAAVLALDAAQVDADLALQLQVFRLAQVVVEQHVFGRDGGVGLQLEHPVPVRPLQPQQAIAWRGPRRPSRTSSVGGRVMGAASSMGGFSTGELWLSAKSAARKPERSAPSMVAGRPVSVQSPARKRLRQAVRASGRLRGLLGRGGEGGAPLLHDLPGRQLGRQAVDLGDVGPERVRRGSARSSSSRRSAPLTVTEMRSGKAKTHSAMPPISPTIGSTPGGGAIRKWPLTMARKSSGAARPGTSSCADPGRDGQDHRLVRGRRARRSSAKLKRREAIAVEIQTVCSRRPSRTLAAVAGQKGRAPARRRPPPGSDGRCAGDRRGRPWPGSRAPRRRPARPSRPPGRC